MYSSKQHCCVKMRKALEECTAVKSWIVTLPAYSYYGDEASVKTHVIVKSKNKKNRTIRTKPEFQMGGNTPPQQKN